MTLSIDARHAAILHLVRASPAREPIAAAAARGGLQTPAPQGVEPLFAWVSRLVLAASEPQLGALADALGGDVGAALRERVFGPPEPAVPEATWDVEEPGAVVSDEPPRPVGTPATAPPADGARTWLVRGVELVAPPSVAAGAEFNLAVRLGDAPASSPAPKGHAPYDGLAVDVELEAWLEEAYPARGSDLHRSIRVDPARPTECGFDLLAADPLPEGVVVAVRFFLKGYEVGRARCRVPAGDGAGEPQREAGVVAIPDTILDAGEDAVATVQS